MTIHVPYIYTPHVAGDAAVSDEWNDISSAVARIDATVSISSAALLTGGTGASVADPGTGTGSWAASRPYATFTGASFYSDANMVPVVIGSGWGSHYNQLISFTQAGFYYCFFQATIAMGGTGNFMAVTMDKSADPNQVIGQNSLPTSGSTYTGNWFTGGGGFQYFNVGDFVALRYSSTTTARSLSGGTLGVCRIAL